MVICMESLWPTTVTLPAFDPQNGDRHTDVLIVGGGLAGILCAYKLKEAGVNCLVAEAGAIGQKTTANTTAKITSQHGLIYHRLLREFDADTTRLYWQANEDALAQYRTLCRDIDCEFETADNAVFQTYDTAKIEKEMAALQSLNISAKFTQTVPLPQKTAGAVVFENQAQFHPLKFLAHVAKDLNVAEHTRVIAYEGGGCVLTDHGRIRADAVIVTTHFPIFNKHGAYFLKMHQHRSYVLGLKWASPVMGMYVDEDKKGLSFRSYQDLLLLGGGSHRTGERGGNWAELAAFARKYYPDSRETYRFATQDCMTLDGVPYIGHYSSATPECYVATGFNKWGMTSSMVAADLLRDLILGRDNPYKDVFSPQRSIWRLQLAVNGFKSAANLLTPTTPRCPHMGCALKWNSREHSWDCPCHGSRFEKDGTLLDTPATDNLPQK